MSKLEKADILEMTVEYLHSLHRQRTDQMTKGFVACLQEVNNFFQNEAPTFKTSELRTHMMANLYRRVRSIGQATASSGFEVSHGGGFGQGTSRDMNRQGTMGNINAACDRYRPSNPLVSSSKRSARQPLQRLENLAGPSTSGCTSTSGFGRHSYNLATCTPLSVDTSGRWLDKPRAARSSHTITLSDHDVTSGYENDNRVRFAMSGVSETVSADSSTAHVDSTDNSAARHVQDIALRGNNENGNSGNSNMAAPADNRPDSPVWRPW